MRPDNLRPDNKTARTGFWGGLLLVAVSVVCGLLLVEGLLRVLDYSRPPFYRYSEAMGANHRPNTEGWFEKEDLVRIRINEDGLRGPDVPIEKPPNVFRIAVIGDSFAEAFQVTFEQRFSHIAEQALNTCDPLGRPIEVLNFGVSGYGTAREILMYREMAQRYRPDLVLLLFTPINDLRNNLRALEGNPFIPYFELDDGRLVLDDSFRHDPVFQDKLKWSNLRNDVVDRVRVLQVLQDFYVRSPWRRGTPAPQDEAVQDGQAQAAGGRKRSLTYDPPETPLELESWAVTEAMLRLLRDETAAAGQDFWLSVVPPGIAASKLAGDRSPGYVEQRLARLAEREGIGFISLTGPLWSHVETTGVDIDYFEHLGGRGGHWNAAGNRVVGTTIAEVLCQALQNQAAAAAGEDGPDS